MTRFDRGVRTTTLQVVRRIPAGGIDPRPGGLAKLERGDVVLVMPGDVHETLAAYSRLRAAGVTNEELADHHRRLAGDLPDAGSGSFREPASSAGFAPGAI